jgi:hypothetical protein
MFKALRIGVLLFILAAVALGAWRTRTGVVEWKYTLAVNLYPISGDGSEAVDRYLREVNADAFKPVEAFMREEARRYGRGSDASIEVGLHPELRSLPPEAPRTGNPLSVALWSLQMRYWAWKHTAKAGPGPQVKLFLVYFDPATHAHLPHSTGLANGLIGVVNVFAASNMTAENNVVITHEFLHTLGATDKYDPATNQPNFPDGYADPEQSPPHPQVFAEIMAGRIPLSEATAAQPSSLNHVVIGPATAREINWLPR